MVVPPLYKTYTHQVAKEAADILCAYIMKKIPKKVTDNVYTNWVLSKLIGWSKNIQPTYVGTWISSAWSNYDKRRNYYATIVHYEKSNYTNPIDVQYFECNNWYK
jgi:inhibitor of KinA sporulation pathway (predicted exonuclease)